jgi:hypothetical protein
VALEARARRGREFAWNQPRPGRCFRQIRRQTRDRLYSLSAMAADGAVVLNCSKAYFGAPFRIAESEARCACPSELGCLCCDVTESSKQRSGAACHTSRVRTVSRAEVSSHSPYSRFHELSSCLRAILAVLVILSPCPLGTALLWRVSVCRGAISEVSRTAAACDLYAGVFLFFSARSQ